MTPAQTPDRAPDETWDGCEWLQSTTGFYHQAIVRLSYDIRMWLGIDVGTGGSRALLVDERGAVRAGCTAAHEEMTMERPQWAEQRPENWWDAVVVAIRGVLAQAGIKGADVKGIGLSGQMHGLVILDDADQVI